MSDIAIARSRELRFSTAVALALGVFSILIAGAFVAEYWVRFGDMIAESGRAVFAERQSAISAQLNGVFEGPQFAALSLAASDQVRNGDITGTEEVLLAIHAFNPQIVNIKIGLESGLYFTTTRIAPVPDTRYYTPPPGAAYAVVTVTPTPDGRFTQTVRFR
ncbi:MAG: hypothetical protein FJX59_17385, partial [Alphaproteobacteria bacterium]|nr:hypothetical protein [Alphaproteobacteria bacterium]